MPPSAAKNEVSTETESNTSNDAESPLQSTKTEGGVLIKIRTIALLLVMILLLAGCSQTVETSKELQQNGEQMQPPKNQSIELNKSTGNSTTTPTVYMTRHISPEGLMDVYKALGREPTGNVAVKLSTGEAGNTHYLSPDLIKDLVQSVNGTIVECNTAYGGSRASTAMHIQVAEDHGFTAIADVDIMDADGSISLPVEGGARLTENFVGANFIKRIESRNGIHTLEHAEAISLGSRTYELVSLDD